MNLFYVIALLLGTNAPALSLIEADRQALAEGKLDVFVRYYREHVHRGLDLLVFYENVSGRERRQLRTLFAPFERAPDLIRDDRTLVFKFDDGEIPVVIPDLNQNQFIIAGVKLAYDPTSPPAWQLRLFQKKLSRAFDEPTAWLRLLLPEAHAFLTAVGARAVKSYVAKETEKKFVKRQLDRSGTFMTGAVGGMMATAFSGTLRKTTIDALCTTVTVTLSINNKMSNYFCGTWKAENVQIAAANTNKQIGYVDDLAKTLKINELSNFKCPKISPDGKSEFTAYMRMQDGAAHERWFKFAGQMDKGELKAADVYRVMNPEASDPKLIFVGGVAFLPSEGVAKNPMKVSIPADLDESPKADTMKNATHYLSTDPMPSTDVNTYKEASSARQIMLLASFSKIVAQNCRQKVDKVEPPAGLKQGTRPEDAFQ